MADIDRILVVSRMSKYCQKAVHYGVSLARKYNAELFVLHVEHNPFGTKGWNLPIISTTKDFCRKRRQTWTELSLKREWLASRSEN